MNLIMKTSLSKITLVLFLLFIGNTNIKAAYNGDCLLDIFLAELKEKSSKEVYDYLSGMDDPKEVNLAYQAWKVLYEADKNIDRLDTTNLTELIGYIQRSEKELDAIVLKIKDAGGYASFKNTPSWFVSFVEDSYKKALKIDLEASKELVKTFSENSDLIEQWQILYDLNLSDKFRQESINIYALNSYIEKVDVISLKAFNNYVKHVLDKDAYMKSILFSNKPLYGGIKIPSELLNGIKSLSGSNIGRFKQYLGADNTGTFEIRVNAGKIERHFVDDAGVGSWKGLSGIRILPINFVITNDGTLHLGHGHFYLSGEAKSVIAAGSLVITDGKVNILTNTSGHYSPKADNLYGTERVFRALGVTSDDFKLDFRKETKTAERPAVNTTNVKQQIDDLVDLIKDVYKTEFKKDLENSKDLVQLINDKPKVIDSWQKLVDFPDLRKDIDVLKTYGEVKRLGNYSKTARPIRISEITKMHPSPKLGKEADLESLKNSLKNEGFYLQNPIKVVQLPDGTKLVMDGNHRLNGMEYFNQEIVPTHVMPLDEAIKFYGEASFIKRVKSGEIQVQGNLSTNELIKNNEVLVRHLGEENIVVSIEIAKLSGYYSGSYTQQIHRPTVSYNDLKTFAEKFMAENFPGWSKK